MKYLHLLLHDEIKFSEKLFRMLNDENLGFNNAEQWFITPYEEVYNRLRKYGDNISFHPESNINLINKYGKQAEWVFVHALNLRKYQVIQIRKNIAKKVIAASNINLFVVLRFTAICMNSHLLFLIK